MWKRISICQFYRPVSPQMVEQTTELMTQWPCSRNWLNGHVVTTDSITLQSQVTQWPCSHNCLNGPAVTTDSTVLQSQLTQWHSQLTLYSDNWLNEGGGRTWAVRKLEGQWGGTDVGEEYTLHNYPYRLKILNGSMVILIDFQHLKRFCPSQRNQSTYILHTDTQTLNIISFLTSCGKIQTFIGNWVGENQQKVLMNSRRRKHVYRETFKI